VVRIGGASAFWGDSAIAVPQLLGGPEKLDFLVFDYLAETTLAIMAYMREKDSSQGYATDFVDTTIKRHAAQIKAEGVRLISNAGGMNPLGCKAAIEAELAAQGVDLKVGVVLGDDLVAQAAALRPHVTDMYTGAPFPAHVKSVNAYLGARPIAALLDEGCDIVLTGRVVDSAVTLGACMHAFGWADHEYDRLAGGTIAGHLIECGAQATGGLHTDWEACESWVNIGYPIAEVEADGSVTITKPRGTDGLVCVGGVAEQLLYEVGDPAAYHVPDVACDFTHAAVVPHGAERVRVSGVRGRPPTDTYKATVTHFDGFRTDALLVVAGIDAERKARRTGEALLARGAAMLRAASLPPFGATRVEVLGAEQMFGAHARGGGDAREVVLKLSATHASRRALELLGREVASAATSMAPGTMGLTAGRPRPAPLIRNFSCLLPKAGVSVRVLVGDGEARELPLATAGGFVPPPPPPPPPPPDDDDEAPPDDGGERTTVLLSRLCWARSGDKGDTANVGVIARKAEYVPFLRRHLTEQRVAEWYAHAVEGEVRRYEVPGIGGFNFVLTGALGGGGTMSLRTDSLAKAFAQQLLIMEVEVPSEWVA
ncbi:hypothetical protein AB1Y20_018629, partial [Prymnesium parvum]